MGRYGTKGYNFHAQAFEGEEWPEELGERRGGAAVGWKAVRLPPKQHGREGECRGPGRRPARPHCQAGQHAAGLQMAEPRGLPSLCPRLAGPEFRRVALDFQEKTHNIALQIMRVRLNH